MSKKGELKKAIAQSREEIEQLERKLGRSQVAIIEAIISQAKPSDKDIEYFRTYAELIDVERENLQKLNEELKNLYQQKKRRNSKRRFSVWSAYSVFNVG